MTPTIKVKVTREQLKKIICAQVPNDFLSNLQTSFIPREFYLEIPIDQIEGDLSDLIEYYQKVADEEWYKACSNFHNKKDSEPKRKRFKVTNDKKVNMNRNLDQQVAEALGWEFVPSHTGGTYRENGEFRALNHWHPSVNIQDAWPLFEMMPPNVFVIKSSNGYSCGNSITDSSQFFQLGNTAAEAICKAFLKWKKSEEEKNNGFVDNI